MILIFTIRNESTTNTVIEWIKQLKGSFHRINGPAFLKNPFTYHISNTEESLNLNTDIPVKNIQSIWYRRESGDTLEDISFPEEKLQKDVRKHLNHELNTLKRTVNYIFKTKKWLSHPSNASLNKVDVLRVAANIGIDIPATIVTSSKKDLMHFTKQHPQIITKPIHEVTIFHYKEETYWKYTVEPDASTIDQQYKEEMFPTLVQELIEKEYEIRAFYLDGQFYSMAIFSQLDTKTTTDFRRYNFQKPNRNIPYLLPKEIENKLRELMHSLHLNTGSIDMIKAKDGRYVFLEINPVGQFGMVSHPCNYYLEKKVAAWLIENDQ